MVSVITKNLLCNPIMGSKIFDKYTLETGPTRKAQPTYNSGLQLRSFSNTTALYSNTLILCMQ